MARFVNKPEYKWTRDGIAERVYAILAKYADFENLAKNKDVPLEEQQMYLDSLDLTEISMYLEHDFQIELDLTNETEYFAGDYTPRHFIDFMCKKLNVTVAYPKPKKQMVEKTKSPHTTDTDVDILMHSVRPMILKRNIRRAYGIDISFDELRAIKRFTDFQEMIRCAINNQNSK
ncbi:MAG: hypothetical protein J5620_03280 [Alphaproteobacteria bacterium]|nr:hypothetical protein [Alphaproteobacteria bacterium]